MLRVINCTQPFELTVKLSLSNPATPLVVAPSVAPEPAILCPDCTIVNNEFAGLLFAAIAVLAKIKSPGSKAVPN